MQNIAHADQITDNLDKVLYEDDDYLYTCRAFPGTPRTAADWIVFRTDKATGDKRHAGGTCNAKWPATDLATVAALSYTDEPAT